MSSANPPTTQFPAGFSLAPPERGWFEREEFQSGECTLFVAKDLSDQGRLMSQMLTRRRADGILELPAFPQQIIQLLELLKNPQVDTAKIVKCLRTDPVVAAEVLRFANSALYAPADRIIDLRHAISFLGHRRLHALALGVATKVASGNVVHPKVHRQLWIHSVACGVLAMQIARETKVDPEGAFLGGLLHDVGKIAVAAEISRLQKKLIINLTDSDLFALLEIHHSAFGESLTQHWRLPEIVVSAVVHHHDGKAPSSDQRNVAVIEAADKICYVLGLGAAIPPFAVLQMSAFQTLDLDPAQAAEMLNAAVPRLYAEIAELS